MYQFTKQDIQDELDRRKNEEKEKTLRKLKELSDDELDKLFKKL